jgi:hypothetical protein
MAKDLMRTGNVFFPRSVGPGTRVFAWIILLSLVLADLFLLDIMTTQLILNMGGIELNPLMTGVVTLPVMHLLLKIGIVLCVIPIALNAEARIKGSGIALYAALIVMYTAVVLNNASVLLPHLMGLCAV